MIIYTDASVRKIKGEKPSSFAGYIFTSDSHETLGYGRFDLNQNHVGFLTGHDSHRGEMLGLIMALRTLSTQYSPTHVTLCNDVQAIELILQGKYPSRFNNLVVAAYRDCLNKGFTFTLDLCTEAKGPHRHFHVHALVKSGTEVPQVLHVPNVILDPEPTHELQVYFHNDLVVAKNSKELVQKLGQTISSHDILFVRKFTQKRAFLSVHLNAKGTLCFSKRTEKYV